MESAFYLHKNILDEQYHNIPLILIFFQAQERKFPFIMIVVTTHTSRSKSKSLSSSKLLGRVLMVLYEQ